jgi:hypothetical protein
MGESIEEKINELKDMLRRQYENLADEKPANLPPFDGALLSRCDAEGRLVQSVLNAGAVSEFVSEVVLGFINSASKEFIGRLDVGEEHDVELAGTYRHRLFEMSLLYFYAHLAVKLDSALNELSAEAVVASSMALGARRITPSKLAELIMRESPKTVASRIKNFVKSRVRRSKRRSKDRPPSGGPGRPPKLTAGQVWSVWKDLERNDPDNLNAPTLAYKLEVSPSAVYKFLDRFGGVTALKAKEAHLIDFSHLARPIDPDAQDL